jgi:growth arrest-specific protein 8
MALRNAKARY